jgi:MFS family permease
VCLEVAHPLSTYRTSEVATLFIRWTFLRAIFHRGWWLVTSLYLVMEADLSPLQLVFLGTAQSLIGMAFEIPTGVVADTLSRKWSIVIAHAIMGGGMVMTGLVTAFPALVVTQMLWGLAWTFSSGADVAWLTDEYDQPKDIARVLAAAARWELLGAATGLVSFGAIAWITDLALSIVVAGIAMLMLGVFVAIRFKERNFTPTHEHHYRASLLILRDGFRLARHDRTILLVFSVTMLVNGADEALGRLFPRRLVDLGLPLNPDPIVWLTTLGLATLALGAVALRLVESRLHGVHTTRRFYAGACVVGALGVLVFAVAPEHLTAMGGVILARGIASPVLRVISIIRVNQRATSSVRATLQSFLSQVEFVGEIGLGFGLGVIAQMMQIEAAMFGACALYAAAGILVWIAGR